MNNTNPIPSIKQHFTRGIYTFDLIESIQSHNPLGVWAIFAQKLKGKVLHLEIQKVRKKRGTPNAYGRVEGKTYYQYPSDSEWGTLGWTVEPDFDYTQFISQKEKEYLLSVS